ncbi:MAG: 4-(cytidine 5'-diphospho)-2-C-methyl-D-erythritol kinase [Bacillota bacterium]|nr:4-(cytidine 5'-diphospho)-2-C-methyl-D-erythritol kinase [Bacillota bacterium]
MKEIHIKAAAKINWSLEITGRREDGYHLLRSLMQQVSLYDSLDLKLAEEDRCFCSALVDQENLAFRAWLALKRQLSLEECLEIHIRKQIPIGAGLAGGSADAAAVLMGANQLLSLGLSSEDLCLLGLSLGADIPFCLRGGACLVEGIGELLQDLAKIPSYWLVLANPGFSVGTPQVFREYDRVGSRQKVDIPAVVDCLEMGQRELLPSLWGNQLYEAACNLYPSLSRIPEFFLSLGLQPLMSGSGGSFFALCEGQAQAEAAAAELRRHVHWAAAVQTLN